MIELADGTYLLSPLLCIAKYLLVRAREAIQFLELSHDYWN